MNSNITVEAFRQSAPAKLQWLVDRGFKRVKGLERETATMGTLVYLGDNIGFEFSFDVRDQCVDAEVVKVNKGLPQRNCDGGYSRDIYGHLVEVERYRGSPTGSFDGSSRESKLDNAITGWLSLLEVAGASLLNDHPESLGG